MGVQSISTATETAPRMTARSRDRLLNVVSPIVLLLIWELAARFGFIDTRLTQAKVDENAMEIGGEKVQLGIPEQMRQMASMLIPLGRPASPEEAAGGIFFLCSPWSNYVHGQTLHITGGLFGGMTG